MTVADAGLGDVVLIGDTEYRLMIRLRGGWLARPHRDGEHQWLDDAAEIDEIVYTQPKRNKKARKAKGRADWDPIG